MDAFDISCNFHELLRYFVGDSWRFNDTTVSLQCVGMLLSDFTSTTDIT
jgi:hypothetical protein